MAHHCEHIAAGGFSPASEAPKLHRQLFPKTSINDCDAF
jgi:hypothetical protein